jgi:hypothetical protein
MVAVLINIAILGFEDGIIHALRNEGYFFCLEDLALWSVAIHK